MAISPVNLSRISQNMRTDLIVDSLRVTQRSLFASQTRIASGRSFITPSEDPVAAARAMDLTQARLRQEQLIANVRHGDNLLSAADSAMTELSDLLVQASTIAVQTVGDLTTAAERNSEAEVVARIRQAIQSVGNRTLNGRYIFAGRETTDAPFIDTGNGLIYVGDVQSLLTRTDNGVLAATSMPGNELFGALSDPITTNVDLSPSLEGSARLDDITGATGAAIQTGTLVFNEIDGAGVFSVNLEGVDTIGDIVGRINTVAGEAGAALTAELGATGLIITPGGSDVSITDTGGGQVAIGLGILTTPATSDVITGQSIQPKLTRLTPVEALAGGSGIDLDSGFRVTNGGDEITIDLSAAKTVQDVINTINNAGVSVRARINEAGTAIDVFNQSSGTSLSIGENGGTTARDLGIRTLDDATTLQQLNFGLGVGLAEGKEDLRVTAKDGSTFEVNLDGADTIGAVITLINDAASEASVSVTASLTSTGNGIVLADTSGGSEVLSVASINLSTAATDLGFSQTLDAEAKELFGADVNPTRTEGVLGALVDLEAALRSNDTRAIGLAGGRLDTLREEVIQHHGIIGARAQAMSSKKAQVEEAAITTERFLSEIQDLDFASAATELQSALTQFQANIQASSTLLGLSLSDFLR